MDEIKTDFESASTYFRIMKDCAVAYLDSQATRNFLDGRVAANRGALSRREVVRCALLQQTCDLHLLRLRHFGSLFLRHHAYFTMQGNYDFLRDE